MDVLRYAAFTTDPAGGNPAGVVLDAGGASEAEMQAVAADVGYSESAFLSPGVSAGDFEIRYFSPLAEVPFCGHATIATAVAYAERHGPGEMRLTTRAGEVVVTSRAGEQGPVATLVSVEPHVEALPRAILDELLALLHWSERDLDPAFAPLVAYAGARHPIIVAASRERLAMLDYDFAGLQVLMAREDWTTVDLLWREDEAIFHCRNPFPPGGVVEDPATGAAAAAFGGYLRATGAVSAPARITLHQGEDLGRPGLLVVDIPVTGGIAVTGAAVALT